jgi:hypothetical protein
MELQPKLKEAHDQGYAACKQAIVDMREFMKPARTHQNPISPHKRFGRFRNGCATIAQVMDPSDITCAKFIQHSWDGYCYFCATFSCDSGAVQAQMHPTALLLTPSQISEISDQPNAQPRPTRSPAQLSTTQHDPAREHDPARPSTAQHRSERPSMAQNL